MVMTILNLPMTQIMGPRDTSPRCEVMAMQGVENGTIPARSSGETGADDPQVRSPAQSLADGDSSLKDVRVGQHEAHNTLRITSQELQDEHNEAPVNEAGRTRLGSDERDTGEPKVEVAQEPNDTTARQSQWYQPHEAAEDVNIQLIYQLLENGGDLEQPTETGSKPLYLATELGSPDIVALLLQAGANVESVNPDAEVCSTALQQAVDRSRMDIAERLLQHGADVNSIGPSGGTPLLMAIKNRIPEMVALLLRYGADKDIPDRSGATPLELAQGSEQITALLREPQVLEGPMPVNKQAPRKRLSFIKGARAPRDDRDKMIALHGFRATIVDFFIVDDFESKRLEQSMSVYKLLYGSQKVMETPQNSILTGKRREFRWYHLPANNNGLR
ncbi:ankyrin repeat-containing domain protein [Xylaria flabelliformis]|nr:ankyrin repeat-containing domain protein [Xylaria flabelliformis]